MLGKIEFKAKAKTNQQTNKKTKKKTLSLYNTVKRSADYFKHFVYPSIMSLRLWTEFALIFICPNANKLSLLMTHFFLVVALRKASNVIKLNQLTSTVLLPSLVKESYGSRNNK